MRRLAFLVLLLLWLPSAAQDDMFSEKRERHRVWKKWNRKRDAYNPYLDRKRKDRPSQQMARDNKREIKKQQRTGKKQMRRSKKAINKANRRRLKGK